MPNWCESDLYIAGPNIHKILEAIKNKDSESGETALDFNKIIPMPESLHITSPAHTDADKAQARQNIRLYGVSDWYEWANKYWGTKWNAGDVTVKQGIDEAKLSFRTAWAPPIPVITALARMFPENRFTLKYYEAGMGFKGELVLHGNKVINNSEGAYRGNRGG